MAKNKRTATYRELILSKYMNLDMTWDACTCFMKIQMGPIGIQGLPVSNTTKFWSLKVLPYADQGPGVVTRTAVIPRNLSPTCQFVVAQSSPNSNHDNPTNVRPSHPATFMQPESGHPIRQAQQPQVIRSTPSTAKQPARLNSELQGVVLTLGGPGSCQNGT